MRFKPGTTQAQMQAAMEALANRPKTRGPAGIDGTRPYGVGGPLPEAINKPAGIGGTRPFGAGGPPPQAIDYPRPVGGTRPYGGSMNLGTTGGPGGGRPGQQLQQMQQLYQQAMQQQATAGRPGSSMNLGTAGGPGGGRPGMGVPPSSQINPTQPNVMGFPDLGVGGTRPYGVGGPLPEAIDYPRPVGGTRPYGASGANPYNINKPADYQPGTRPYGGSANLGTTGGPGGGRPDMLGMGQQAIQPQDTSGMTVPGGPKQGVVNRVFAKGGKVSAKAPVKKAAGGKIAAKAPVKKAMGGKVAAKPMAKPVAKKAKPMSAMKRGGKVTMKGRYK